MIADLKIAKGKVETFNDQFENLGYGEGHFLFAQHAAFPIAFTADMLYQLWANFKAYPKKDAPEEFGRMNYIAVSDLLLSNLCKETKKGLFEMDVEVRGLLLDGLRADERFGDSRLLELARFLYQYVEKHAETMDPHLRDLQIWTAFASLTPFRAAEKISQLLSEAIRQENEAEVSRINNLMEIYSQQDGRFKNLLYFSEGLQAAIEEKSPGEIQQAFDRIWRVSSGQSFKGLGVKIPLPKELQGKVQFKEQAQRAEDEINSKIAEVREKGLEILELRGYVLLKELPQEVFSLTQLTQLIIENCAIERIPKEISSLKKLEVLSLSGNKIETIPQHLAALPNLKALDLSRNKINDLPTSVGDLTYLESLEIQENKIDFIPPEIRRLKKLSHFRIEDNPILNIPKDALDFGIEGIGAFFNSIEPPKESLPVVLLVSLDSQSQFKEGAEIEGIVRALQAHREKELLEIDLLENPTTVEFYRRIYSYEAHLSILHIAASQIFMKNEAGERVEIKPATLAKLVGQPQRCNLFVLNVFGSEAYAESLLEKGFEVGIGVSKLISGDAAIEISSDFYRELSNEKTLEEAFQTARQNFESKASFGKATQSQFSPAQQSQSAEGTAFFTDEFPWVLFLGETKGEAMNWKLPPVFTAEETSLEGESRHPLPWQKMQPFLIESFDYPDAQVEDFDPSKTPIPEHWQPFRDEIWTASISRGVYHLENSADAFAVKYIWISLTQRDVSNLPVTVELKMEHDGDASIFGAGLICRFNLESRDYYAFIINNDRQFGFYRREAGSFHTLFTGRSRLIQPNDFNKIALVSEAGRFHLYIGDQLVNSISDVNLAAGDVGIIAIGKGAFSFDNLALYEESLELKEPEPLAPEVYSYLNRREQIRRFQDLMKRREKDYLHYFVIQGEEGQGQDVFIERIKHQFFDKNKMEQVTVDLDEFAHLENMDEYEKKVNARMMKALGLEVSLSNVFNFKIFESLFSRKTEYFFIVYQCSNWTPFVFEFIKRSLAAKRSSEKGIMKMSYSLMNKKIFSFFQISYLREHSREGLALKLDYHSETSIEGDTSTFVATEEAKEGFAFPQKEPLMALRYLPIGRIEWQTEGLWEHGAKATAPLLLMPETIAQTLLFRENFESKIKEQAYDLVLGFNPVQDAAPERIIEELMGQFKSAGFGMANFPIPIDIVGDAKGLAIARLLSQGAGDFNLFVKNIFTIQTAGQPVEKIKSDLKELPPEVLLPELKSITIKDIHIWIDENWEHLKSFVNTEQLLTMFGEYGEVFKMEVAIQKIKEYREGKLREDRK